MAHELKGIMADRKSFLLRINPGLWAELEAWAADELRSVNGQIEYLLKRAVTERRGSVGNNADLTTEEGIAKDGHAAPNAEQGGASS